MRLLNEIHLDVRQHSALGALRHKVEKRFPVERLILYGSVARGEAEEESDLDVLVVTEQRLSRLERHEITDAAFEVNLHYGTNLSTLVVDRAAWESGLISVLPLREEILRDGIPL